MTAKEFLKKHSLKYYESHDDEIEEEGEYITIENVKEYTKLLVAEQTFDLNKEINKWKGEFEETKIRKNIFKEQLSDLKDKYRNFPTSEELTEIIKESNGYLYQINTLTEEKNKHMEMADLYMGDVEILLKEKEDLKEKLISLELAYEKLINEMNNESMSLLPESCQVEDTEGGRFCFQSGRCKQCFEPKTLPN